MSANIKLHPDFSLSTPTLFTPVKRWCRMSIKPGVNQLSLLMKELFRLYRAACTMHHTREHDIFLLVYWEHQPRISIQWCSTQHRDSLNDMGSTGSGWFDMKQEMGKIRLSHFTGGVRTLFISPSSNWFSIAFLGLPCRLPELRWHILISAAPSLHTKHYAASPLSNTVCHPTFS